MANFISRLPNIEQKKWSYLEEMGVSNKETVIAEILRYFFDPNEIHKLGDVFIKALLHTKPKYLKSKEKDFGCGFNSIQDNYFNATQKLLEDNFAKTSTTVKVEVNTLNNNRIDIVINSEKLVIAIEFKINHHLDNPLNDYVDFIKGQEVLKDRNIKYDKDAISNKGSEKKKYFVVLTPFWKKPIGQAKKNNDFVQIILADFIINLKNLIGNYWENKKYTHQYFIYQDLINTIENRGKLSKLINDYYKNISEKEMNTIEKLFKFKQLDSITIESLILIKKSFENKTKELLKKIKDNYQPLNATKERIESGIVKKIDNETEYKIRLTLIGWHFEKWINNKKIENNKIGTYFSVTEDLIKKVS